MAMRGIIAKKRRMTTRPDKCMAKRKLKVGDKIRVTGYRTGKYPRGTVDDMGTEDLFKRLVGRRYTVRGFDRYGNVELRPTRNDTVWIEPDLVEMVRARRVV